MAAPDVSKFVGCCKDYLHAEWSTFKKSGIAKPCHVCIYSIGGQADIPAACIESIGNGFKEIERTLRETIDLSIDMNTPLISEDVMVSANGHITIFPTRKSKPRAGGSVTLAGTELKSLVPPAPGRKTKLPPSPEVACMGAIEQIANYMIDHLKRISESCLINGNIKVLYYVLASALLVKCRVMSYKQAFKTPSSKALTSAVNRCNETIDIMTQHLLNYHSDMIRSVILHDAASHDWHFNRVYEEGEKISLCIQMWSFYVQGIHNDLWRFTSSKVGETIFCNIFTDTLSLLVTRYTQIRPSELRLSQMRGDIIAIMAIVASFLPSLTSSPRFLFTGDIHDSPVFAIHRRMELLLRVASLKCAPVETLAKVYSHGIFASKRFSPNSKEPTHIYSCPSWLTFLNPRLFPDNTDSLDSLPDNVAVYLTLNNAALRPYPDQALIVRGLFMRDFLATKTLLRSLQDLPGQVERGSPCEGCLCLGLLCTPPLIPHTVYAAIVQIITVSFHSSQILNSVMLSAIKESAIWDSLDRKQVWNIQRPPWHHALVSLVGLQVAPVVAKVLESVPAVAPAKPTHPSQMSVRLEHHLSAWTLQLINGMTLLAETLPLSLLQIAHSLNDLLPPTIKPVGGHVISQLIISATYSIVNSRSSLDQLSQYGAITDGQWDMMIAVGERLCSLHDGNYDAPLQHMIETLLKPLSEVVDDEDETFDIYTDEETIEEVSLQMAGIVMSSVQGKHAFGIIWKYLKQNMSWVSHALKVPPLVPPVLHQNGSVGEKPAPEMSFTKNPSIYNPLKFHDHIFFTKLNHEEFLGFEGNWESVLEGDLWMPKEMIEDLIMQRPEMQNGAVLTPGQVDSVKKLKILSK